MPVPINGRKYYRTAEVCLTVGIAKSTLLRWIKTGIVNEARHKDRRGWRLFAEDEIDRLQVEVNRIESGSIAKT